MQLVASLKLPATFFFMIPGQNLTGDTSEPVDIQTVTLYVDAKHAAALNSGKTAPALDVSRRASGSNQVCLIVVRTLPFFPFISFPKLNTTTRRKLKQANLKLKNHLHLFSLFVFLFYFLESNWSSAPIFHTNGCFLFFLNFSYSAILISAAAEDEMRINGRH